MSLFNVNNQTYFRIRKPDEALAAANSGVTHPVNFGASSTGLRGDSLVSGTIIVSPTTSGQEYTIPESSQILAQFRTTPDGRPIAQVGDTVKFDVVNIGSQLATVKSLAANHAVADLSVSCTGTKPLSIVFTAINGTTGTYQLC